MLDSGIQRDQASRLRQMTRGRVAVLPGQDPRVITITSGKGGVGKSTVALNLSLLLCGPGRRVLLVDADANLGNLDVMLGIAPEFRLGHALRGEKRIDDVLVSPFPGLHLLPGSSGDTHYPFAGVETPASFVAGLKKVECVIDDIVIDTSAGLTRDVVGYAVNADEVIVVSTPEPTAIMDAYAMIKVIHATRPEVPLKVMMNAARVLAEADAGAATLAMATDRFLGKSFVYLGAVPYDDHVVACVARQRPVAREFPNSRASQALAKIASQFLHPSK